MRWWRIYLPTSMTGESVMYRAETVCVLQTVWLHPVPLLCGGCPRLNMGVVANPRFTHYQTTVIEGGVGVGCLYKKVWETWACREGIMSVDVCLIVK